MTENRDKKCPFAEICEELHGANGEMGYTECNKEEKCTSPYNEFCEGMECND